MNRPPSILINSGFVTDANGVLTGIVIPDNVTTLENSNLNVVSYASNILSIPINQGIISTFTAYNVTNISRNVSLFNEASNLSMIRFVDLVSLAQSGSIFIASCPSLTSVHFDSLEYITTSNTGDVFEKLNGLTTVTMSKFKQHTQSGTYGVFYKTTSLQSVQLGSDGHAVEVLGSNFFQDCTQSGLTITIYTRGGSSLVGEPWGATNATIEYEEA